MISIEIPPLRERPEDILPIAWHVLRREAGPDGTPPGISHEAQAVLENYPWPGNVRELENVLQHALAFTQDGMITPDILPAKIISAVENGPAGAPLTKKTEDYKGKSLKSFLRSKEKEYLMNVIKSMDGDKEKAAKALNISLATLYRKIADT